MIIYNITASRIIFTIIGRNLNERVFLRLIRILKRRMER